MTTPQVQLPLEVRLRDDATFDNYLSVDGAGPVIEGLRQQLQNNTQPMVFIAAQAGSGKSHLLQASCQEQGGESLYLPLAELAEYPAQAVLQEMQHLQRLCCDDLQAVAGNPDWELELFHLINRCIETRCRLVFAATTAPRGLGVRMPDLASRLSGAVVYRLPRLDDAAKIAILCFRAGRRGLLLPEPVARFIVHRAPREMEQLLDILDQLDQASLAEQRPLSIPFVKAILGW